MVTEFDVRVYVTVPAQPDMTFSLSYKMGVFFTWF